MNNNNLLTVPMKNNNLLTVRNDDNLLQKHDRSNIHGITMIDEDDVILDGGDNEDELPNRMDDSSINSDHLLHSGKKLLPFRKSISKEALNEIRRGGIDVVKANVLEMQCKVCATCDEPQDIDYDQLYGYFRRGRYEPFIRRITLQIILVIIFCFFGTPLAIVSGLQSIIARNELLQGNLDTSIWRHVLHAIIYQYIPTLLMFGISVLLTSMITLTTTMDKYKTTSEMGRTGMKRGYVYSIIAGLLLPSFWLSSIDGIAELIIHGEMAVDAFSRLFLPASGAFFMNLVIQRALLKGAADILRLHDVFMYIWKSRKVYFGRKKREHVMSPKEHLAISQLSDFQVDREYNNMVTTLCIILTYSMYSPLMLLCGVFYIIMKHYVDRFSILFIYGHKAELDALQNKSTPNPTQKFKSDYNTHSRRVQLISKLFVINFIVYFSFQMVYYGAHAFILSDKNLQISGIAVSYLPHLFITFFGTLLCIGFLVWLDRKYKRKYRQLIASTCTELDLETHKDDLKLAYEPPQSYLTDVKKSVGTNENDITQEELRELKEKPLTQKPSERAADFFCCFFTKCIPLRAACEQMIDICCWGFLDSIL
jgi:hypothetical protein